jgi:hypothetical protein
MLEYAAAAYVGNVPVKTRTSKRSCLRARNKLCPRSYRLQNPGDVNQRLNSSAWGGRHLAGPRAYFTRLGLVPMGLQLCDGLLLLRRQTTEMIGTIGTQRAYRPTS